MLSTLYTSVYPPCCARAPCRPRQRFNPNIATNLATPIGFSSVRLAPYPGTDHPTLHAPRFTIPGGRYASRYGCWYGSKKFLNPLPVRFLTPPDTAVRLISHIYPLPRCLVVSGPVVSCLLALRGFPTWPTAFCYGS